MFVVFDSSVKGMVWTRTSRSHDISGPVQQVSVLVVLDGGACPGALQGRAGSTAPPPPPRHTPHHATSKAESATFATTRVVLYPTIRQWNGCPSDKRQLVWSVVHAVKGRTGRSAPRRRARGRGQGPGSGSETHSEASPDHSLYFH